MFHGIHSVIYYVTDLKQAKAWYKKLLNIDSCVEWNDSVIFDIDGTNLVLQLQTESAPIFSGRSLNFWRVKDIESVYQRLLELGSAEETSVEEVLSGTFKATVTDPFGNIIGIAGPKSEGVEEQPSKSAVRVAFARAIAAIEKQDWVSSVDHLAKLFLPDDYLAVLDDAEMRRWVTDHRIPPGLYEFFAVRTIWFDSVFDRALENNCPQIVIIGAGYDSRALRFKTSLGENRVFEVDIHTTQQHKQQCLARQQVSLPTQLTYVSADLRTDSLELRLLDAGYNPALETLFLWEGVTYYLSPQAIDAVLGSIKRNSRTGSTIAFDYALLSPQRLNAYGVNEMAAYVETESPGEPIQFFMDEGQIVPFLEQRGFNLISHYTPEYLENKYLTREDGTLIGRITACFAFVHAAVE